MFPTNSKDSSATGIRSYKLDPELSFAGPLKTTF